MVKAMAEYIKKEDIMAALERERQTLLERGQYGAEHILVHSAINLIDELPVIETNEL